MLLGQCGRRFRRKAFLYSPVARYLEEMGLAARAVIVEPAEEDRNEPDDIPQDSLGRATEGRIGTWILSRDYLHRCAACTLPGGKRAVILNSWRTTPLRPATDDVVADLRTGRRVKDSHEECANAELQKDCLNAARSLLGNYARNSPPQLKRVVLWAHVAQVAPFPLLIDPDTVDDETLSALLSALAQDRVSDRDGWVSQVNRSLEELRGREGVGQASHFTAVQVGTYLTRLRQDYRRTLANLRFSSGTSGV